MTFWDIKEQKLIETASFTANICGIWFDGSLLACALDDFTVRIYSMKTHFEVDVIGVNEEVNLLQFDRNKLVSGEQ